MHYTDTTYHSMVSYQCKECYQLVDGDTNINRTCESNGEWNGSFPVCRCEILIKTDIHMHQCYSTTMPIYNLQFYHIVCYCTCICFFLQEPVDCIPIYITIWYSLWASASLITTYLFHTLHIVVHCKMLAPPQYGLLIETSNTCGSEVGHWCNETLCI